MAANDGLFDGPTPTKVLGGLMFGIEDAIKRVLGDDYPYIFILPTVDGYQSIRIVGVSREKTIEVLKHLLASYEAEEQNTPR